MPDSRTVQVLPCRAHGNWSFVEAEVLHSGTDIIRVAVVIPIEPGEEFLLKVKDPVNGLSIANYTFTDRAPHVRDLHLITATFEGFITNPRNQSAKEFAAALAAAA